MEKTYAMIIIFPSVGAANTALTAMANALRASDHLLDRLNAHVETPQTASAGQGQG